MKTAILTDSGSAMTIQQAQEHGIFLLPLQVIDEEHSYQDGVDISTEELYEALRKQHTPKTSMPVGSVIGLHYVQSRNRAMKKSYRFPYHPVFHRPSTPFR